MVFKEKYRNIVHDRKELRQLKDYFGYKKISSLAWLYNTEKKTIPIEKAYSLALYLGVEFLDLFEIQSVKEYFEKG